MSKIGKLREQAATACRNRGHEMKTFRSGENHKTTRRHSECRRCGAWVTIDTDPPANGIDIGGTAVALNCQVKKEN